MLVSRIDILTDDSFVMPAKTEELLRPGQGYICCSGGLDIDNQAFL